MCSNPSRLYWRRQMGQEAMVAALHHSRQQPAGAPDTVAPPSPSGVPVAQVPIEQIAIDASALQELLDADVSKTEAIGRLRQVVPPQAIPDAADATTLHKRLRVLAPELIAAGWHAIQEGGTYQLGH